MATHTEWLNSSANVLFAWTECQTDADRTEQIRSLLKEEAEKESDSNDCSIFVMASELERRLLIMRMNKDEGDMLRSSERVAIYSYESLLETLRSTGCKFWQKQSVNFFYQFDIHFAAVSCLAVMQIMYAVRTKAFRARCRCLIMVPHSEVLKPLFDVLDMICPYQEKFTQVTIPQQQVVRALPPKERIPSSEFVGRVIDRAVRAFMRQKVVIVFCTKDTEIEILEKLPGNRTACDCLSNEVAHADVIAKKCSPVGNEEEAVILFMTEINHVPLYFEYASDIFIEGLKDTPSWDRSRIVHRKQLLTEYELRCMISYWHQCQRSTRLTVTDRPINETIPTRLVDHAQSWGYLADLAFHFEDINFPYLASCFMRIDTVLETVMTHFLVMGFLKGNHEKLIRPFTVCEDAERVCKVLVLMDHDFHLAWFVRVGMRFSGVSVTARCAMLRIAALAKCKFAVIEKAPFAENFTSRTKYKRMVDALVQKLEGHASMPRHLHTQGLPWITLMIWHLAQKVEPSIRTGELQSLMRVWPDVPMCMLDLVQCAHVSKIMSALDSLYAVEESAMETLHLTDADCEEIQRTMVAAWLHKAIVIESDGRDFQLKDVVRAQLARDVLSPGLGEILLPPWVLGTPGTTENIAFFAGLHVVEDYGERYYSDSVALPMRLLGLWRSPRGETFLRCAAYCGPDDP